MQSSRQRAVRRNANRRQAAQQAPRLVRTTSLQAMYLTPSLQTVAEYSRRPATMGSFVLNDKASSLQRCGRIESGHQDRAPIAGTDIGYQICGPRSVIAPYGGLPRRRVFPMTG